MKIQGTTTLIAGAASGMGAAAARHFRFLGAKVVLLDANAELCRSVAEEIRATAIPCDITDPVAVEAAFRKLADEVGAPRLVLNCAGIAPAARILGKKGIHDLDLFRRVLEVNLIGTFNVMRFAAAEMSQLKPLEDNERGVIINTASIAAYEGQIGQAAYSASKAGIVGMTIPAAREFAPLGIRVMTIAPGLIETPMFSGLPPAATEALSKSTLFPKRLGRAEEFAHLIEHVAENVMLNGSTIRLDGAVRLS